MAPEPGPVVTVDELKHAWAAGASRTLGQHDETAEPTPWNDNASGWFCAEGEHTIAIVGCAGSVGASTLAMAAALSTPRPVRVVECCSATASGLETASTAELGTHPRGWRRGRRAHVLIERTSAVLIGVDDVPLPAPVEPHTLTLLDVGWEVAQLSAGSSWLTAAVGDADLLVLVGTATVPGMRRLATALDLLAGLRQPEGRVVVAVRGPRRRKWHPGVEHAGGPQFQRLSANGALVEIPESRPLAVAGLDSRPVPPAVVTAAGRIVDALPRTTPTAYSFASA